jgi:hypothetical protein
LSYLARNRPYVGVKGLDASKHLSNDQIQLAIEVRNVGEIPAVEVRLSVSDSGGQIDLGDIYLGPLFSHTTVQIRRPVPEAFTYSADKEQSYFRPIAEERREMYHRPDDVEEFVQVYPEGEDATLVVCTITYKAPGFWDRIEGRTFKSVQTFRVGHDGRAEPAQSQQGRIT